MIYSKKILEKKADEINRLYFPKRLEMPGILDPYDFLEAIGCSYEWKYISPDDTIPGMTFFDDGYWYTWPDGDYKIGDMCHKELFAKGTVVINQRLLDSNSKIAVNRERFVAMHEGAHWIKDSKYFQQHSTDIVKTCAKNDFESTVWRDNLSTLEIIERQTNYLATAIMMPEDVIREAFFKAGRYRNIPEGAIEFKAYMNEWICKVSKEFGVNFNPVKYRLKDLNIIKEQERR